jgi:hypothetical protein
MRTKERWEREEDGEHTETMVKEEECEERKGKVEEGIKREKE